MNTAEPPDYVRLRAVVAKRLMAVSPVEFPSLRAVARVAGLIASDVLEQFAVAGLPADQVRVPLEAPTA